MKKYTAPEMEIIKFRIQEAIADNEIGAGPSGSIGAGDRQEDDDLPGRP